MSTARRRGVTCLVADDHPAMVQALADMLAGADVDVVGTARNGEEALAKIETRRPEVAVLDVRMPRLGGIEVARRVSEGRLGTAVILYTAYAERALLNDGLDAGARGFVLKEAPVADLLRAIEVVAGGGTYVDPVIAGFLTGAAAAAPAASLTQRERDVLRLLSDGLSNEEVGKRLFISAETVRTHVRKAMAKLDADTRTQAVATALRQSLIS